MQWLDNVPLPIAIMMALTIGLAPFFPEPHIVEKLRMLKDGMLHRPLDIFDLLMHGAPWVLLVSKLAALGLTKSSS